jgi:hypothetical protein
VKLFATSVKNMHKRIQEFLDVGAFGEEQPFNLNIVGTELEEIETDSTTAC